MDKELKKSAIQLAYASSVGIAMVLAIFGCLLIGVYLDRKFDTGSVFTFIFLLIGIVAGFRNLYVLIKRYFTDDEPIIKSLKSEPHRQRPSPKKN
ncbi:MAG TPA: AtpZ/AtpI family protein [Smithellaceae bacterium]|jgi:ATP synthase protein I|nr:AtpZ/AtpI family protein [Syntrophaceae bacterium]MDX9815417.1 AtpZ/AtpI family protein [Smithellaceae bacterium]NMD05290.1 AtpZ/AtpI family protein [Deltaproteobacteria bacterium]OPZ53944.1 MAG: putative F0F1-ATPase [Deltaproteobacteria bacterium ADurb.BinA014]MBP8609410.1 AtpZ/AtpI family protein [Syntrophaceae bacterium]